MDHLLRNDELVLESRKLDDEMFEALSDSTRRDILRYLSQQPSYPTEVSGALDISRQKAYYHFNVLEDAGLIEVRKKEEKSGGTATFYAPSSDAFHLDLGTGGKKVGFEMMDQNLENFLNPLLRDGELNGRIVVGSPDEHGPDQVRARDGHLAGDICLKLGSYADAEGLKVEWDTEVFMQESFESSMLIVGGVLTNRVARKFNEEFPARFEGEEFPYHSIRTPENRYSSPEIGLIARADNPLSEDKKLFLVAGIRNRGTKAAVRAFMEVDEVLNSDTEYLVVEGTDMDGDGRVDSYELREEG